MREFVVGLLFLAAVGLVIGMCFLIFPLLLLAGLILRFILVFTFGILAIWLLGKFIILIWNKLKG